jgi:biopolymer transport protein ExbB
MKYLLPILALTLFVAGAQAASAVVTPPVPAAQAAPVTTINDRGARPPGDTFTIPGGAKATAVKAPGAAEEEEDAVNMWELLKKGGLAMYILAALSIVLFTLVIVYLFTLRRGAILTPHYMNTADVLLKKRDYLGLLAISSRHTEVVARIVQRTLDFATKNPSVSYRVIEDIAQTEGSAQAASLQHRVTYLADIGVLAPMVGLLGTVVGIFRSFHDLGRGTGLMRDVALAGGVSQSLVTTGAGLFLGIFAMMFYALFRNRVHSLISDMEIASAHIMGLLALSFAKKPGDRSSRIPVEEEF